MHISNCIKLSRISWIVNVGFHNDLKMCGVLSLACFGSLAL